MVSGQDGPEGTRPHAQAAMSRAHSGMHFVYLVIRSLKT
jgi:hypothetical protein